MQTGTSSVLICIAIVLYYLIFNFEKKRKKFQRFLPTLLTL